MQYCRTAWDVIYAVPPCLLRFRIFENKASHFDDNGVTGLFWPAQGWSSAVSCQTVSSSRTANLFFDGSLCLFFFLYI